MSERGNPENIQSNGKSPGERKKCFRMWQVLAGASNLPPDAVQSHEHTLHTYTQLPDIREKARGGERERARERERDRAREKERYRDS